jgi:predicted nucleic acid-binding protein
MTVALDTMTLIWGVQRGGNPKQSNLREMQCRACILIDMLQESDERVLIPCVAVAEYLTGIDPADHANSIAALQKNFFCPPFDIRATDVAAKLFLNHKNLPADEQTSRRTLKSDVMIVATAKTAGATTFYSHDPKCRKLAQLVGIAGKDLPTDHPDMYKTVDFKKQFGLA